MSGLFETLQVLHSMQRSETTAWQQPIIDHARETFFRLFDQAKLQYCRKVLEGDYLSDTQIKELFGYASSSAASAMREGKIGMDRFHLLQATIGRRVSFPASTTTLSEAFVETVEFVRRHLMQQIPKTAFDLTVYRWVEQSLAEDLTAYELEHEGDERAWLKHLLKRVQSIVPVKQIEGPELIKMLIEWGPAYITAKNALSDLIRD